MFLCEARDTSVLYLETAPPLNKNSCRPPRLHPMIAQLAVVLTTQIYKLNKKVLKSNSSWNQCVCNLCVEGENGRYVKIMFQNYSKIFVWMVYHESVLVLNLFCAAPTPTGLYGSFMCINIVYLQQEWRNYGSNHREQHEESSHCWLRKLV